DNNVILDRFMLLNDSDGWTNGYMADLTNIYLNTIQSKAQLKSKSLQLFQFNTDKKTCPEILKVLTKESKDYKKVIDIELNLKNRFLKLITLDSFVYINP